MGTIPKYLFGTMDNNGCIKYDFYVNTLKKNKITINNNIKGQSYLLKEVTESCRNELIKISNNQRLIKATINNFLTENNYSFINILKTSIALDNAILQCRKRKDLIDHIQLAINFAQANIVAFFHLKN